MTPSMLLTSLQDLKPALAFLSECLENSMLFNQFGLNRLSTECEKIDLVTSFPPPQGQDYYSSWEGESCTDWLIDESLRFLHQEREAVVVFEDVNSTPSDPYLKTHPHPAYWHYQNRLLWPIVGNTSEFATVEATISWAASFRTIAVFSKFSSKPLPSSDSIEITPQECRSLVDSITRVVVNVFDDGGYMIWWRRE